MELPHRNSRNIGELAHPHIPIIVSIGCSTLRLESWSDIFRREIRADAMMNAVYHASRNNPISGNGLGVHIINSSFGISNYYEYVGIHKAYNFAYENGVSLVCSRGNSGTDAGHYPATFDPSWITSVGALDTNHRKADFSSFGLGMDFLAPGTSDLVFTTYPNNEWGYVEGTSFAAPHVTGAIAALRALFISPNNPFNPFGKSS